MTISRHLRHVCLSSCTTAGPTGRISLEFHVREFYDNLPRKIKILLQSDKNIGQFTWRPKLHCCRRNKFTTQALLWNTRYFYIVDSDLWRSVTHSVLLRFKCNSGYANVQQYYTYIAYLVIKFHWCLSIKNCWTIPVFNHIRSQWGPLFLSHKLTFFI